MKLIHNGQIGDLERGLGGPQSCNRMINRMLWRHKKEKLLQREKESLAGQVQVQVSGTQPQR